MTAAHSVFAAAAHRRSARRVGPLAAALLLVLVCSAESRSQPASAAKPVRSAAASASADQWQDLTSAQKQFLQPLEHDWSRLDPQQRRKWLVLTTRSPGMSADERLRVQARMTEWATLTPEQRGQARLRYQEARKLSARDRQARWDAYQSLPPEQKQQLAARASLTPEPARKSSGAGGRTERSAHDPLTASNVVPNPALSAQPRSISPTVMQARPGATTTLIGKRAMPPSHQQNGMPKIAATPEFVDKATLLPQRGPQAATARRSTLASGAEATSTPAPPQIRSDPK